MLCALGVLLAELIFFLFMRAISGQRWWGKFPVFWKVTFYLFLLSLQQLFVTGQFFFFLGQNKGFSINNPLLPLMIPLLSLFPNVKIVDLQTAKLLFVPTLACMGDCFASYVESVESNDFFRILVTAGCRWGMCQQKVFLAPESFFDYYPKHLKKILWQDCLGFQDIVVAGATISADNAAQRHQVALVVQQKQVCCMHKQLLCPLYEEFYFTVVPQPEARLLRIGFASYQLMICAEFFLAPLNYSWPRSDGILLLVKEKMFPEFFYKMLLSSAIFFSLWRGKSIIWVDYNGLRIINFFGRVGNKELVYGQKGLRNVD